MPGAPAPDPLQPYELPSGPVPAPDPGAAPEGFLVTTDDGTRIHFQDWGGDGEDGPAVVLVPGLLATAWSWAPVARRLRRERHTVVADLRGHGLSDGPPGGYDASMLAEDVVTVVEGSGASPGGSVVLAGHGFGGAVAAAAAVRLGSRCRGLVLVDGGWERTEETTGTDVDSFLRGLDEPPEVLRSIDAWLADRRGFDPPSWDADQEQAAREAVVETAAGRVVRAVRPHVVEAIVRGMFAVDPAEALARVAAPVTALVALGSPDVDVRLGELRRGADARAAVGLPPVRVTGFAAAGHNLMRYRPAEVCAAILAASDPG